MEKAMRVHTSRMDDVIHVSEDADGVFNASVQRTENGAQVVYEEQGSTFRAAMESLLASVAERRGRDRPESRPTTR